MVNYNNSSLLAVSKDQEKFIIPGIQKNCPENFKSIENFLNYNNGDCEELFQYLEISNLREINI